MLCPTRAVSAWSQTRSLTRFAPSLTSTDYLPDYQPLGVIQQAGLVAPEFEIGTAPFLIGYLNGVRSLVNYGLCDKYSGFGSTNRLPGRFGVSNSWQYARQHADGGFTFKPKSYDAAAAVGELDMLLTAGRLNSHSRVLIQGEYTHYLATGDATGCWAAAVAQYGDRINYRMSESSWAHIPKGCTVKTSDPAKFGPYFNSHATGKAPHVQFVPVEAQFLDPANKAAAVRRALLLLALSSEFHTTGLNVRGSAKRQPAPVIQSLSRPYKAIIVLEWNGGADSFNLIVPHSNCRSVDSRDLPTDYKAERGVAALTASTLLSIAVPGGTQPCDTFGVHPKLPGVKRLYDEGDAAFIANVGNLIEPIKDKAEYEAKTKLAPKSLYAHNVQQAQSQNVHSAALKTKGVLGRIMEALTSQDTPFKTQGFSLAGNKKIFEGLIQPDILSKNGVIRWDGYKNDARMKAAIDGLTSQKTPSIFAETYSALLEQSLATSESLGELLETVSVDTPFAPLEGDSLTEQFKQVAKVIKSRGARGDVERDVFFVRLGGFDTHSDLLAKVDTLFTITDHALAQFEKEMKLLNLWDNVVVLEQSEFGRTLRANGAGTDHAWGGHAFLVGGKLKGAQILGRYPDRIDNDAPLNVRTGGRFIPTTSWEAVWHGLSEWFGVDAERLGDVLPQMQNYPSGSMFKKEAMFDA